MWRPTTDSLELLIADWLVEQVPVTRVSIDYIIATCTSPTCILYTCWMRHVQNFAQYYSISVCRDCSAMHYTCNTTPINISNLTLLHVHVGIAVPPNSLPESVASDKSFGSTGSGGALVGSRRNSTSSTRTSGELTTREVLCRG